MPTYQYRCVDCEQSFERYQSFTDDPITVCPLPLNGQSGNGSAAECGGEVRKVFSNVGISFKGSGFYRNDSRSDGKSKSKSSDSPSSSDSSSESSAGTSDGTDAKKSTSTDSSQSKESSGRDSSAVGAASASG